MLGLRKDEATVMYQFQWLTPFYSNEAWHLARLEVVRVTRRWPWFWKTVRQRAEIEVCPKNHAPFDPHATAALEVFANGTFHQHHFDFRFANQGQLPRDLFKAAVRWVQIAERRKATPWTALEPDPLPRARILDGERA